MVGCFFHLGGKMIPCSVVFIKNENNQILVLRRSADDRWMPNVWALPGGKAELNETPEEAAIREVKEETNLDVSNLKFVHYLNDKKYNVSYFTTSTFDGNIKVDQSEHSDYLWISVENLNTIITTPLLYELAKKYVT